VRPVRLPWDPKSIKNPQIPLEGEGVKNFKDVKEVKHSKESKEVRDSKDVTSS